MGCCASMKEDSDYPYDSTWESDDERPSSTKQVVGSDGERDRIKRPTNKKNKKKNSHQRHRPPRGNTKQTNWPSEIHTRRASRNLQCAKDMQSYRHKCRAVLQQQQTQSQSKDESEPLRDKMAKKRRYAEISYDMDDLPNLQFYRNEKQSIPDGVTIDDIHKNWYGDYQKLESVHTFIQWLFPLQEQGVNRYATPLTKREIKMFHDDETVKKNLLKSYKLMLDFYGLKLLSEQTGEVDRRRNWKERYENLNGNPHNNLRITRILKCLGLLGFSHYQEPLVRFFLIETLVRKNLPQVKKSVLDYFMFTVLDTKKRRKLIKFAFDHFEPKEEFVWCPEKIQRKFLQDFRPPKNK